MARKARPARRSSLKERKIVITTGPTREYLDDVRFLSNASTGRMGVELAREARRRGARVVLIHGPIHLPLPKGVDSRAVTSTADLLKATRDAAKHAGCVIFAAAPADYRPARRRKGKPAREGGGAFQLALAPTTDVAATLGARKGGRIHVGFALEVGGGEARARRKLERKNFDAIVLNHLANLGEGGGKARWVPAKGSSSNLPTTSKQAMARAVLNQVARLF